MKTVLSKATSLPALSEEDLDDDTISSKSKTRSKSIDSDKEYRKYSMEQTQKVIDITRNLNNFFPNENNQLEEFHIYKNSVLSIELEINYPHI